MIIMFSGIPACGKTTIARCVAERLQEIGTVQLINSDELRPPVYKKMFKAVEPRPGRAAFIILDATFSKQQQREHIEVSASGETVLTVYLECPLEVALERNRARSAKIPEKALHIVSRRFEPPQSPTIRIDTSAMFATAACSMIIEMIRRGCE